MRYVAKNMPDLQSHELLQLTTHNTHTHTHKLNLKIETLLEVTF